MCINLTQMGDVTHQKLHGCVMHRIKRLSVLIASIPPQFIVMPSVYACARRGIWACARARACDRAWALPPSEKQLPSE